MWKFEYPLLTNLRRELASQRARVEQEIASARAFTSFLKRSPELYITYLPDAETGSFPITSPCLWPKEDRDTLMAVIQAACTFPAAQAIYARILLSAKDSQGNPVFPAGRVDLLLGRRIATPLPEDHPALKMPAKIKHKGSPTWYAEREEN